MSKKLAITISPPKRVGHISYVNQNQILYMDDVHYIKFVLKKYHINRYIIYPELDVKGRLHYHGILTLNNHEEVSFYKCVQFKLSKIGHVDVSLLKDFKENLRWCIYMGKEWGKTREIIDIEQPVLPLRQKKLPEPPKENPLDIINYFEKLQP